LTTTYSKTNNNIVELVKSCFGVLFLWFLWVETGDYLNSTTLHIIQEKVMEHRYYGLTSGTVWY